MLKEILEILGQVEKELNIAEAMDEIHQPKLTETSVGRAKMNVGRLMRLLKGVQTGKNCPECLEALRPVLRGAKVQSSFCAVCQKEIYYNTASGEYIDGAKTR